MKAVGYVRASSEEQAQPGRFSMERQRTTIEQRALRDGYEVTQWFQDIESGEHVNREGYQEMLTFLRRKGVERVYIWESSRLERNDREFLRCCWELKDLGIEEYLALRTCRMSCCAMFMRGRPMRIMLN